MNVYDLCCCVLPGTDIKLIVLLSDEDSIDKYKTITLDRFRIADSLDGFFFTAPVDFVTSSGWNIQIHTHCDSDVFNKIFEY